MDLRILRLAQEVEAAALTLQVTIDVTRGLEGVGRRIGYVLMLGTRLEAIDDGLMKESGKPPVEVARVETQTTEPVADKERKVIPFRRKDR